MTTTLRDLRPIYVVGVGIHPYQRPSETPYTALGVHAAREALLDAGLQWGVVETAYTGTANTSTALSRLMYRHLGSTGIPMVQVENASASGASAFRGACIEVAAGLADVAIAVGVDKPLRPSNARRAAGVVDLVGSRVAPFTHFALLAQRYIEEHGATPEQCARVAVKNTRNGSMNPNAQRRTAYSLEQVMEAPLISGVLTRRQCCPVGEGAAAVIIASESGIERLGIDRSRAVRVLSSAASSEVVADHHENHDVALTRVTTERALADAGVAISEVDIVELHDAFTVEELLYAEAMGLSKPGAAANELEEGQFDIGGRVAVSASGGLLAMGHPIGPTGVGQIAEITRQLRGEAGQRQHPGAKTGLAHLVGVGAVCLVHVLRAAE
jgi:acetyl-CoA acetyltransferase